MNVKRTKIGSIYRSPDFAGLPEKSEISNDVKNNDDTIATVSGGSCELKGGIFDFNTRQREGPVRFSQDVNKYDIHQDYRQKNSLKYQPYDVKTTKYLVERNTPTHQNIDSFIKQGQNKMNDTGGKRRRYYGMLTSEQKRSVYDRHEFTDIIRTKAFFKSDGFGIQGLPSYLWSLIDYGRMRVYIYAFEDTNHSYRILTKFPDRADPTTQEIMHMKGFEKIRAIFSGKQLKPDVIPKGNTTNHIWKPTTLIDFWDNPIVKDAFLNGHESDVIDRDNITIVNNDILNILGFDPREDIQPKGSLAEIYKQMEALDNNERVDGDKKNIPDNTIIQVQDPQNLEQQPQTN